MLPPTVAAPRGLHLHHIRAKLSKDVPCQQASMIGAV
jgi:hypothetical protein